MTNYNIDPALGQKAEVELPKIEAKLVKGDFVYLLPGDHGNVTLRKANPGNVSIIARGGAKLTSFKVAATASDWTVAWFNFRGLNTSTDINAITRMVDVAPGAKRIHFVNNTFAAVDDTSKWTLQDWVSKPFNVGLLHRGTDSLIQKNTFFNLRNCLSFGAGSTVDQNTFRDFGNDAIQFGANNIKITKNVITKGRHSAAEPLHGDGMQGYPAPVGTAYDGVLIEGNTVDMNGATGDYLQGISAFDGRWKNVVVRGNTVKVNAWHAITWFGVDGILIENNIVGTVVGADPKLTPWICVDKDKLGVPSSNIVVRNNTCATYRLPAGVTH